MNLKGGISIWLCFICLVIAAIQMHPGFAAMADLLMLGVGLIALRAIAHLEGKAKHEP